MEANSNLISFLTGATVVHSPLFPMPQTSEMFIQIGVFVAKAILGGLISIGINYFVIKSKGKI